MLRLVAMLMGMPGLGMGFPPGLRGLDLGSEHRLHRMDHDRAPALPYHHPRHQNSHLLGPLLLGTMNVACCPLLMAGPRMTGDLSQYAK